MHPISGTIDRQASVEIEGCIDTGNRCQVTWGGKRGWVNAVNLGAQSQGKTVIVSESRAALQAPKVVYQEQLASASADTATTTSTQTGSTGTAADAAGGALLGGPIGAVIGGLAGGAVVDPPGQVNT